jgi:predicted transcriptional regulator
MKAGRKIKLSVSLSSEVVDRIDAQAKRSRSTRSAVMEEWLQAGERLARRRARGRGRGLLPQPDGRGARRG